MPKLTGSRVGAFLLHEHTHLHEFEQLHQLGDEDCHMLPSHLALCELPYLGCATSHLRMCAYALSEHLALRELPNSGCASSHIWDARAATFGMRELPKKKV